MATPESARPPENRRNAILAGPANFIDPGSIAAGEATRALWQEHCHLSGSFVGVIGARIGALLAVVLAGLLKGGGIFGVLWAPRGEGNLPDQLEVSRRAG